MPSPPALEILYQDEWMVAINKPAGWLVHPAAEPQPDDLVAMKILRDQIGKRVNTIHRIDRPTTGILLMGTDPEVSKTLHHAFANHQMKKTYWAAIQGSPSKPQWECSEPIQKEPHKPIRTAHTSFKLIKTISHPKLTQNPTNNNHLSLIEAIPHTGRFHQIRRHLLHAGLPIIGDYRYGGIERCDHLGNLLDTGSRMLLMAKELHFTHPITNLQITIQAPPDPMFIKCLLA